MSFRHSSVIPSTIVHVGNILSFGCHFIHSMVIRALEWRGMTFCWNDRNDVRMMISVIPDVRMMISFIPVIPNYRKKWGLPWFHSCHSDLIPSFGCHSKIQFQKEWCRNDRWFLEKVDHFPFTCPSCLEIIKFLKEVECVEAHEVVKNAEEVGSVEDEQVLY